MFRVQVAVIRQEFFYIKYRTILITDNIKDAAGCYVIMQKQLRCHCLIRIVGRDTDKTVEVNPPDGFYHIPPLAA